MSVSTPIIRTLIIPAAIVLLSLVGAVTLYATSPELVAQAPAPIPPAVRVLTVVPTSTEHLVHSQGTVEPRTESALVPEVAGRVEWVAPALVSGGSFRAGDALLRIERDDYETNLDQARATLEQAEAEAVNARFELERLAALLDRKLASRSQYEAAERRGRVADAALRAAEGGLSRAERDLARTSLTAPFDGIVRDERVDVGQFVNRGEAVATVYSHRDVEIRLPIADAQLAWLDLPATGSDAGAPSVELEARFAGEARHWSGRIVRAEGAIDPRSRMVNVVARVEDPQPALPVGLFVEARIRGRRVEDVVTLPRSALREGNRVLVVDGDDRMFYRDVEPLRFYGDAVMIERGLSAGERVCVSPVQTVVEGMTVAPVDDPSAAVDA